MSTKKARSVSRSVSIPRGNSILIAPALESNCSTSPTCNKASVNVASSTSVSPSPLGERVAVCGPPSQKYTYPSPDHAISGYPVQSQGLMFRPKQPHKSYLHRRRRCGRWCISKHLIDEAGVTLTCYVNAIVPQGGTAPTTACDDPSRTRVDNPQHTLTIIGCERFFGPTPRLDGAIRMHGTLVIRARGCVIRCGP
eukprot:1196175-Prorocentrum_minimum.AAC.3